MKTPNVIASLFTVVATTALALAQAPTLSAPISPPGDLLPGLAPDVQVAPRVAAGGSGYLVVWSDARSHLGGQQSDFDVFALRLDGLGAPLDPAPIPVAVRPGWQRNPRVAWNGADWLVVFEDQLFNGSYYSTALSAARVSSAGVVLDPAGFRVRPAQWSDSVLWDLCANGAEWVVASSGTSGGEAALTGHRIGANGVVVNPAGTVLVPETYFLYFGVNLAASQGEVLLTYTGASTPVARRFGPTLAPIGAAFTPPGTNVGGGALGYYVTWNGTTDLLGSPMTLDGTLAFPAGLAIESTFGITQVAKPAWDGSQWWIGWSSIVDGIVAARVATSGTAIDAGGVQIAAVGSDNPTGLSLAGGTAAGAQFAWTGQGQQYEVFGANATPAFVVGPVAALSTSAPSQLRPALCAGPDGFALAYESQNGETRRVLFRLLDPEGVARTAGPLELGSGPGRGGAAVAWNGALYAVAWNDGLRIVVQRFAPDGTPVDAAPLLVMASDSGAAIAAVGRAFLIGTTVAETYPQFRDAVARRFDGDTGNFLDAAPTVLGAGYAQQLRMTSMGDRWLVVWQSNWSHNDPQATNLAAIVLPDGTVSTNAGIDFGGSPDAAGGNGKALLVWRLNSLANANNDVACCTIQPDGTLGPKVVVSAAPGRQLAPRVAWDGTQWLIAWEDQRNQTSFFDAETDVYGARVNAAGALLDPAGFPWRVSTQPVAFPVLAARGARVMLATSAFTAESPLGAYRIELVRTLADCFAPAHFCDALPNSTGQRARVGSSGTTSLAANDLVLTCTGLPATTTGIFFAGDEPAVPFGALGNGLACVGGTLRRVGAVHALAGAVWAPQNLGAPIWGGVQQGDVRYVQLWYRNVAGGGAGSNASDALELTFCP